jgi:hypothetical protein
VLCPVRISASYSLLAATMNQKSSLREVPQVVSGALTADSRGQTSTLTLAAVQSTVKIAYVTTLRNDGMS